MIFEFPTAPQWPVSRGTMSFQKTLQSVFPNCKLDTGIVYREHGKALTLITRSDSVPILVGNCFLEKKVIHDKDLRMLVGQFDSYPECSLFVILVASQSPGRYPFFSPNYCIWKIQAEYEDVDGEEECTHYRQVPLNDKQDFKLKKQIVLLELSGVYTGPKWGYKDLIKYFYNGFSDEEVKRRKRKRHQKCKPLFDSA